MFEVEHSGHGETLIQPGEGQIVSIIPFQVVDNWTPFFFLFFYSTLLLPRSTSIYLHSSCPILSKNSPISPRTLSAREPSSSADAPSVCSSGILDRRHERLTRLADKREFVKISQAVGMGFLIMGAIGYFIKLSTWFTRPAMPIVMVVAANSSSSSHPRQ